MGGRYRWCRCSYRHAVAVAVAVAAVLLQTLPKQGLVYRYHVVNATAATSSNTIVNCPGLRFIPC
jgi:hypothetical protein